MKPPPGHYAALQARAIEAMCTDMSDLDTFKRNGFAQTNALRAVSIATSERDQEGRRG